MRRVRPHWKVPDRIASQRRAVCGVMPMSRPSWLAFTFLRGQRRHEPEKLSKALPIVDGAGQAGVAFHVSAVIARPEIRNQICIERAGAWHGPAPQPFHSVRPSHVALGGREASNPSASSIQRPSQPARASAPASSWIENPANPGRPRGQPGSRPASA